MDMGCFDSPTPTSRRRRSNSIQDGKNGAGREKEDSAESAEDEAWGDEGDKDDSRRKRATPEQVFILEQVFDMNPLPTAATKKELAKRIGMSHRQIQVWFQNKRARMKRMGQVPKCKDPFVFHHLAVAQDGEFSLKAEGFLPEEVENLLPTGRSESVAVWRKRELRVSCLSGAVHVIGHRV